MPSHDESAASGLSELENVVAGRGECSPAGGESVSDEDVVFITIYKKDRDWINKTKGKLNREERLHVILKRYRLDYGVDV